MQVKEVAVLTGVSVRTLHHYDEIGLLSPVKSAGNGYRIYSDEDLATLQQILFFRALDFPLKEIKKIMSSSHYNRLEALEMQRKMLLNKQKNITNMLGTIEKTIQNEKGAYPMSQEEKFQGFDFSNNPYEEEARQRWGDKKVDEANQNAKSMTKELQEGMNQIYQELAAVRHIDPASKEAQQIIKKWYDFLNDHFTTYTPEVFQGLGMMYVEDERFTKNIDQFGEGLAIFMSEAMTEFAKNNNKLSLIPIDFNRVNIYNVFTLF
ncbi:DNA-binding transcriptional regulator, MerR family [Gracilibacillus orientalis]|uniref:DNA-binding transcriptional regulator, MerR family n=1 Tax=Gracilibacillus orientalis TaxID=334253 RepID=A0A1I4JVA0_9BACI|nr:MerR family transcriptional regulator [Gracilibacillus orientalis]SFL70515.1 DNA-binding transcriptional regulator, MerR family [Gracilibacillus orientalis]